MTIQTAYTIDPNPEKSAVELAKKFSGITPRVIVYFASSRFDPSALAAAMQKQFPAAQLIGCTTAGEIVSGKMLKESIVAMAFDAVALEDFCVGVVEGIKTENRVPEIFAGFESHTGQKMMDLDIHKYVGIILVDGMSVAEERLMEKIGDLTNVTFIGGSAGDDLKFQKTYVFANGKAYTDAAVLALLKPTAGFDVIKTQSFRDLKKILRATRVDEAKRTVIEFNAKPAAEAYAQVLGVTQKAAGDKFMSNPVGLMVDDQPFVRSPQQFQGESMVFYCNIKQGMELHLLESMDIVKDTRAVLQAKQKELGKISGLINFHCILRTLELEQRKQTEDYGKVFADIPSIGFSTYGEEYLGHINQTATMLVFK
jgi:hypothetical protein